MIQLGVISVKLGKLRLLLFQGVFVAVLGEVAGKGVKEVSIAGFTGVKRVSWKKWGLAFV